ncbi:MAG: Rab GTPase-activating protein 1, partial [Marteilia pararefringens]
MPDEQEIPQSLREKIDYFLAGELEKTRIKEWRSKMGDIYFKESNFYALNKNKATKYDREIIKDITRTFPSEKLFQDTSLQIKMFHIVRTYCVSDQDLGYCQGMCFPVGCILKYFSESDAFCIFTFIMRDMRVKNLYEIESGSLSFLKKTFLSALKKHSPAMHKKIIDLKYEIDLILIPWTVALGCSLLNYNNIIEIIDLIL